MAKPSERDRDYRARASKMRWPELSALWIEIKAGLTPGWTDGKAFEHLVVRAFELNKLTVEYPYHVPPGGNPIEEIDGVVYLGDIGFLLECKDRRSTDVEAVAKLGLQLLRRPPATMGCVFATGQFTRPALTLADFAIPHRILLWSESDVDIALGRRDFKAMLQEKHRQLVMYGMTDHSPNYKGFEK